MSQLLLFCLVFIFLFCCLLRVAQPLVAQSAHGEAKPVKAFEMISLRIMGDSKRVRVITVYNAKPKSSLRSFGGPSRLVIELPKTSFSLPANTVNALGLVDNIRYGGAGPNRSRIIFGIKTSFRVENAFVQRIEDDLWQEVFDVVSVSEKDFSKELAAQFAKQQQEINEAKSGKHKKRHFRVVIDAGHGGIDSGAKGVSGTLEKDVTLSFARSIREALKQYLDIEVFLTREEDVFLRLGERVAKARALSADLFISIHMDSIAVENLRGATVYTISDKASDSMAKRLAESENKADLLDGLPADDSPAIADILLDLAQRETHAFSVAFADRVVASFEKNGIRLIKNPHRYGGFQVLSAPDIPSVLVEVGYLSNIHDEKMLLNETWRIKVAQTLAKIIYNFSATRKNTLRNK